LRLKLGSETHLSQPKRQNKTTNSVRIFTTANLSSELLVCSAKHSIKGINQKIMLNWQCAIQNQRCAKGYQKVTSDMERSYSSEQLKTAQIEIFTFEIKKQLASVSNNGLA
jgi:hypothetical protein